MLAGLALRDRARADGHVVAALGEMAGNRLPDSPARPGNQGNFGLVVHRAPPKDTAVSAPDEQANIALLSATFHSAGISSHETDSRQKALAGERHVIRA